MFSAVSGSPPIAIDVRQRVRRGDLPEEVWIVDDRREEVDRLDEREIVGQHEDPRVVEGLAADEQARIRLQRERPLSARVRSPGPSFAAQPAQRANAREAEQLLRARSCRGRLVVMLLKDERSASRRSRGASDYGMATIASISTSTPRGSPDTCTVERAGRASPSARP